MKIANLFILFFWTNMLFGQTPCNCLDNFDTLTTKIKNNYAGYNDRIKQTGRAAHQNAFNTSKQLALNAKTPRDCFHALVGYVQYFKNAHLGFNYLTQTDFEKSFESIDIEKEKPYLKTLSKESIEGLWQTIDSSKTVFIKKDKKHKGSYKVIIQESQDKSLEKGLVYATLQRNKNRYEAWLFNNFSSSHLFIKKLGNTFIFDDKIWVRQAPFNLKKEDLKRIEAYKKVKNGFFFTKLDNDIAYLKIESFMNNDEAVDAFVKQQDAEIRKTPYLIIDLRDNGGGSTGWISFAQYVYTKTFKQGISYMRLSADNKPIIEEGIKNIVTMEISPDMKRYFTDTFMSHKNREYQEIKNFKGEFFPTEGVDIPFDSILKYPKKVALLVNEGTGSSCEYFLHLSKQSTKTTSFGSHTMGIMDYVGQSTPTVLPFKDFFCVIPIEKSSWTNDYLTTGMGMKPDVLLEKMDESQWINYVIKYLKR